MVNMYYLNVCFHCLPPTTHFEPEGLGKSPSFIDHGSSEFVLILQLFCKFNTFAFRILIGYSIIEHSLALFTSSGTRSFLSKSVYCSCWIIT